MNSTLVGHLYSTEMTYNTITMTMIVMSILNMKNTVMINSCHSAFKTRLETKASSHEGQCIPAGSSVSLPRMVLITIYVNNNHA